MNSGVQNQGMLSEYYLRQLLDLQSEKYREEHCASGKKYADPKNLNRYEATCFSQCGEDGIIREIFTRIGTTNRYFVEFGAGNGLQNSTLSLLIDNWVGAWIEGDSTNADTIRNKFRLPILKHRLSFANEYVTAENIETLFTHLDVPAEFDVMSIDIDGNDYWIWKAIQKYHPRVVVCEYNGRYGASQKWVMTYNPSHRWNGSCYYGASLKSLELLGVSKGYHLVCCNLAGINAFFVRDDCRGDLFNGPFTAENHFEPQRFFLIKGSLQKNEFGPFESV